MATLETCSKVWGVFVFCMSLASCCVGYQCLQEGELPVVVPNTTCSGFDKQTALQCCTPSEATVPDPQCSPLLWRKDACQAGFYNDRTTGEIRPCPAGFYCPDNKLCIIPCPLGSFCVPSTLQIPEETPSPVMRALDCMVVNSSSLLCCTPSYNTLQRKNVSGEVTYRCGGPPSLSKVACPKGYYCPNTTTKQVCPSGHYCRPGTVNPHPCPKLSNCPSKTSAPVLNGIGLLFDAILIILMVIGILVMRKRDGIKRWWKACGTQRHLRGRLSRLYVNIQHVGVQADGGLQPHSSGYIKQTNSEMALTGPRRTPLSGAAMVEMGSGSMISAKKFTISISFSDLSLALKKSGKVVLHGATGHLRPSTLTAIMGGSGAGKTTLLNTLSGKAYYGNSSGSILINGRKDKISNFRSVTGFVPQEDIMHRTLTVREVLVYQGVLRLSGVQTIRFIKQKVDEVIELLGLSHVQDSLIGDEETRGISGGQRKRVNIGMELVADPTLLFLDEPTSGLDSVSSKEVCEALRRIAEEGHLTIAAVLHQPRYEIFNMFHEIILLQPGGTIAFQGTTADAKNYFDQLGYVIQPNINPADHYLDVIDAHNTRAKRLAECGGDSCDGADSKYKTMSTLWSEHIQNAPGAHSGDGMNHQDGRVDQEAFTPRPSSPFYIQLFFFLKRSFVLQYRSIHVLILDQFLVLIAGAVLGALYSEVLLRKLALLLCMTSLAIGLTSMLASLRCFGNDKAVFWRESARGINRVLYFLAVNISQIPIILITPLVFLSLFYTLTSPRAFFVDYYVVVLMAVWASHGMGYAISVIFNQKSSQMATVVLILISAMLSGAQPSLCKMKRYKVIGPLIYSLSFSRWFVEALFEKEAKRYPPVLQGDVALYAGYQGYSLDFFGPCVTVLFAFGVVARIIALICLLLRHRGQQK